MVVFYHWQALGAVKNHYTKRLQWLFFIITLDGDFVCVPEVERGVDDGFDDAAAHGEVAKAFVCVAFCRPRGKPAVDDGEYFRFGDVFLVEARDACAFAVAPLYRQIVLYRPTQRSIKTFRFT